MLSIKLSGDADHGWMGEVHDGDALTTYNPEGGDVKAALNDMLTKHFKTEQKPAPVVAAPTPAPAPISPNAAPKPPDPPKPA